MQGFLQFYRWGMEVKLYMSIYTLALIFFKGLTVLLQGETAVNVWVMLEMLLICFAFAVIQYALFPGEKVLNRAELIRRTVVWAVCGNVLIIGGALIFQWFAGLPVWGAALLIVLLEASLYAMWFGDHVARWRDTRTLNEKLRQYQKDA